MAKPQFPTFFARREPAGARALHRRADRAAVKAFSLLLLARPPEAELGNPWRRTGSRARLLGEILGSEAFCEEVLLPFIAEQAVPQQRLDLAEFGYVRGWLQRLGVPGAAAATDWVELLALFVSEGPAAAVVVKALPAAAAGLQRRAEAVRRTLAASRRPIEADDVRALYLLLLNRHPESEAVIRANRGRPRGALIAELLLSGEFRDGVLARFFDTAAPRRRLDRNDLAFAGGWLERFGAPASADADWSELFARFLAAEPAASLIWRRLSDQAARLAGRVLAVRRIRAASREPMAVGDIEAIHLLLLGRLPDGVTVYRANRGRPRILLMAEIARSAEFRDLVMRPFLSGGATPHDALAVRQRDFVRAWLENTALLPAPLGADWAGLFSDFLIEGFPATGFAEERADDLAELDEVAAALCRSRAWSRSAAATGDVEALHLLLLGRLPDGAATHSPAPERTRGDLAAEMVRSPECRERTLLPLLADEALPHRRLGETERAFAAGWLARSGLVAADADADWRELVAALLLAEPIAGLCGEMVSPYGARLRQKAGVARGGGIGALAEAR